LGSSIDRAYGGTGTWTEDEGIKLKDAVQSTVARIGVQLPRWFWIEHKKSCSRWHFVLHPSIYPATGHHDMWTPDKDDKVKDSVKLHGGKDWGAIAALVQGQCAGRWRNFLNKSIDGCEGVRVYGQQSKTTR
jgi:hypothetical protein